MWKQSLTPRNAAKQQRNIKLDYLVILAATKHVIT